MAGAPGAEDSGGTSRLVKMQIDDGASRDALSLVCKSHTP